MTYDDPWRGLPLDPRLPEHAHIRAADRDRDAVAGVLAQAYAEGRLDHAEHDQRTDLLAGTRTLGELPALVADLLPPTASVARRSDLAPDAIRARAVEKYERERQQALWTMLSVTTICVVIWVVGNLGSDGFELGFPWPLFVLLGTGLNYGKTRFDRQHRIEEEVRRLERKADKRARRELPPADPSAG